MAKNSNLLVNVPTKDKDVDKDMKSSNVIGNGGVVNTSVVSSAANTGTIGRNGTLCKKVYLWKVGLLALGPEQVQLTTLPSTHRYSLSILVRFVVYKVPNDWP